MGNFVRLVGTLAVIAAIASFGLSAVYNATHEITAAYKVQEQENARREVLPDAGDAVFEMTETDTELQGRPFVYYTAYGTDARDDVIGWTFTAYGKGYSSTIETIVGVVPGGTISGVKIVFQQETPGLGAKVTEVASENTLWAMLSGSAVDESGARPWFQVQFDGRSADELAIVKSESEDGILAITGATISSEAVTASVREGLGHLLSIVEGGAGAGAGGVGADNGGETDPDAGGAEPEPGDEALSQNGSTGEDAA
ncbi:MAG: FMN-binding protein [Candidatus Eisenbacteria bacterium]|nr:FMN-binding protein [Candidatus Eisenbacteria bacterium]